MSTHVKTYKPDEHISNLLPLQIEYLREVLIKIVVDNLLVALQWEALLFRALLDPNNAKAIVTSIRRKTLAQLTRPEAVINEGPWEKIDVRNVEHLRTRQRAGKKKNGGKKKATHNEETKRKDEEEGRSRRKTEDDDRLRKWEESWGKKLQAQEELDGLKCCKGEGLALKPRTQSNIWINVVQDKVTQDVQISFKHVPVPKPKPPPLPRLKREDTSENVPVEEKTAKKAVAKSRKGSSKKKK